MKLSYVLRIARKSLLARKTRTLVTIGGIVIGVSAIVFLVSLGYGLQHLVTTQVTQLNALSLAEVTTDKPAVLKIDNAAISNIKGIAHVKEVQPLVNLAGKLQYKNATVDVVAFGTTARYLDLNSLQPTGRVFTDSGSADQTQEVIINTATLKVLNLPTAQAAMGQKVSATFVLTSDVAPDITDATERAMGDYTIVGVLTDTSAPSIYVRLKDLQSIGVQQYSQVSVLVNDTLSLGQVRTAIEKFGYKTASVADTVAQINQVFSIFQIILAAVGAIALVIAALGMFNTLTVSLLERTREIGFMKALGTKDSDVYRIFLTEAMTIAITGGFVGIVVGYGLGQGVNLVLKWLAHRTGNPEFDIFLTPMIFAVFVLVFAALIGFLTGLFPARRAAKISPLDALRYE